VSPSDRAPFFGSLPERGPWTAVELTRSQFATILGLSVVLFVFVGGPLWSHLRDPHFTRIAVSYGVIPPAVAVALYRNGAWRLSLVLGASALIAVVKLLLTAGLMVVFALAR
jgi:hypothetical protein